MHRLPLYIYKHTGVPFIFSLNIGGVENDCCVAFGKCLHFQGLRALMQFGPADAALLVKR